MPPTLRAQPTQHRRRIPTWLVAASLAVALLAVPVPAAAPAPPGRAGVTPAATPVPPGREAGDELPLPDGLALPDGVAVPDGRVAPLGLLVPDDGLDPRLLALELRGEEWRRATTELEAALFERSRLERERIAAADALEAGTRRLREVSGELDRVRRERQRLADELAAVEELLAARAIHRFVGLGTRAPEIDPVDAIDARRRDDLLDSVETDLLARRSQLLERARSIDDEIVDLSARRVLTARNRAAADDRLREVEAAARRVTDGLPDRIAAVRLARRRALVAGTDLPVTALQAYLRAESLMAERRPGCGVRWWQLAGVGRVESRHGRLGPAELGTDGRVRPAIVGVALDGSPGVRLVVDTDAGALDGDPVFDRAVGPLQFIPETWSRWGLDADGDGRVDPQDIDDAAAAAARYLCHLGRRLDTTSGWRAAVHGYNNSTAYVALVDRHARRYRDAVPLPSPPAGRPGPS